MYKKVSVIMTEKELISYIDAKLREGPKLMEEYVQRNGKNLPFRKPYFEIKKYLDDFILGNEENRYLVMPGLRGVGKTTIQFQLYDYLLKDRAIEQDRILYIATDELRLFLDSTLIEVIQGLVEEIHRTSLVYLDEPLFIFIDEAHYDPEWSKAGKIVYDQTRKIFMLFTGSSALNLEMNVDAARRVTEKKVFPMSFSEYLLIKRNISPSHQLTQSLKDLVITGGDESFHDAVNQENMMNKKLLTLPRSPQKEWEDFISFRGFPFGLDLEDAEVHDRIFNMIERIVEKDVFTLKAFNTETRSTISRMITFLALQKPGGTSDSKLSQRLGVSPTLIRSILNVLEKTQLIFSVKPYGSAGKISRKPWKYYFLSPSLKAAMNYKLGRYDPYDRESMGVLAENLVASYFFWMIQTTNRPHGIFYPTHKGGADFLLFDGVEDVIPVEVGLGKTKTSQLKRSISKYNSKHAILISGGIQKISKEDNIIKIPLNTFSMI